MGFGEAEFPGNSGMFDARLWRSSRAPVETADEHHIGVGFGHTGSNRPDAHLGYQLNADTRMMIDILKIVNQFGQVLDRINVMMRRWRNQTDTWGRVTHFGNPGIDFPARQLT